MVTRKCRVCDTPFEVPYPSTKRTNCSAKCRGVKTKIRADAGLRKSTWVKKPCACGKTFEVPPWGAKENTLQTYCSPECRTEYRKPITGRPSRVQNFRRIEPTGYVKVYVPPEERPPGLEYVSHHLEHRVVMAQIIGRHLLPDENVHHINGQKHDNRPENLELWTTQQPKGQRVNDLIEFAFEILERYAGEILAKSHAQIARYEAKYGPLE